MSVVNYSLAEISNLKNHVAGITKINDLFIYSKEYKEYLNNLYTDKNDTPENRNSFLNRTFWYMYISNQIAYSLQYQENPVIFTDEPDLPDEIKHTGNKKLLQELNSLSYNITTNDGNKFICDPYYSFYESIQQFLYREIADIYNTR